MIIKQKRKENHINVKGKKSQAAMEFLMTYGWAILAAVIAIGVLAYFGVFSPGKYITGNAVVNPPFYVIAANAKASYSTDGGIQLALKNNGGEAYRITDVIITNCGNTTNPAMPLAASSDSTSIVTVYCDPANKIKEGDTIKGDVTITYRKEGIAVDLTSTGTVAQKVVA